MTSDIPADYHLLDKRPIDMLCKDLLCNMWANEANYRSIVYEEGITALDMPTKELSAIFTALHGLRLEGIPIMDALILQRTGPITNLERLGGIVQLQDVTRSMPDFVKAACGEVRKDSKRRQAIHLLTNTLKKMQGERDSERTLSGLSDELARIRVNTQLSQDDAADDANALREWLAGDPIEHICTGIPWFDELAQVEAGQIVGIAAPYKARKTTLMLNMLLGLVLNGASAVMLSREMPKQTIVTHFIAMMASAWLRANGHWEERIKSSPLVSQPVHWISSMQLRQARKAYKQWHTLRVQAVDAAIAAYYTFGKRLFILDSTPENGGLSDAASLDRAISYMHGRYGITHYGIDYLQLFAGSGDYDAVAETTAKIQHIAASRRVTPIVAMQLNEDKIKNDDDKSYSPGIKGGGDAAQAVDYLVSTRYRMGDNRNNPDNLTVTMALSRHGDSGTGTKAQLEIHRSSGLLLDNLWVNKMGQGQKVRAIDL